MMRRFREWLEYRRISRTLKPVDKAGRLSGIRADIRNAAGEAWDLAGLVEDGSVITFDRIKTLAKNLDTAEARLSWIIEEQTQ
jgi:hypothetical protein